MKILLDECVDRRFARDLIGHEVTTVPRRGWAGIKNGDLLVLAEKEFEAFVTVDRKLATQQDLTKFKIAIVLVRARTNRLEDIRPLRDGTARKTSSRSRWSIDYRWHVSLPSTFQRPAVARALRFDDVAA